MRLVVFVIGALSLLPGCSTTSGMAPTVEKSGFDGATIVSIDPHGNGCSSYVCTGLGAQWSSTRPLDAILRVRVFNEYKAITSVRLMIDSEFFEPKPVQPTTSFERPVGSILYSTRTFSVPLAEIRKITSAKKAWLRVTTTDGYLEDPIVDRDRDSKALHALRRFVTLLDESTQVTK